MVWQPSSLSKTKYGLFYIVTKMWIYFSLLFTAILTVHNNTHEKYEKKYFWYGCENSIECYQFSTSSPFKVYSISYLHCMQPLYVSLEEWNRADGFREWKSKIWHAHQFSNTVNEITSGATVVSLRSVFFCLSFKYLAMILSRNPNAITLCT